MKEKKEKKKKAVQEATLACAVHVITCAVQSMHGGDQHLGPLLRVSPFRDADL